MWDKNTNNALQKECVIPKPFHIYQITANFPVFYLTKQLKAEPNC